MKNPNPPNSFELQQTEKIFTENIILRTFLHAKACARWVLRFLTIDQKQQSVDDPECSLNLFKRNSTICMKR